MKETYVPISDSAKGFCVPQQSECLHRLFHLLFTESTVVSENEKNKGQILEASHSSSHWSLKLSDTLCLVEKSKVNTTIDNTSVCTHAVTLDIFRKVL